MINGTFSPLLHAHLRQLLPAGIVINATKSRRANSICRTDTRMATAI